MEPSARLQELVSKLRLRGCRLTPQRMAVLQVLVSGEEHPSVEEIYERVRADFPMTSLSTVYKTLTLLKEMGEVWELDVGDGGSRYDGSRPEPHPHLVCLRCHSIVDLDLAPLAEWSQSVAQQTGYKIVHQRLEFLGICPQCQGSAIDKEKGGNPDDE